MKTPLFSIGTTLLVILCFHSIATAGDQVGSGSTAAPIHLGYFLVISACFLGAALAREPAKNNSRFRLEIYRQLSREPQSIDELMKSLENTMGNETPSIHTGEQEKTLVEMLEQGHLICREGRLEIPK